MDKDNVIICVAIFLLHVKRLFSLMQIVLVTLKLFKVQNFILSIFENHANVKCGTQGKKCK